MKANSAHRGQLQYEKDMYMDCTQPGLNNNMDPSVKQSSYSRRCMSSLNKHLRHEQKLINR